MGSGQWLDGQSGGVFGLGKSELKATDGIGCIGYCHEVGMEDVQPLYNFVYMVNWPFHQGFTD